MLFRDVLVDEKVKQQLISQVKNNRISHAQLFLSPPGGESLALSIAYAQYLSCGNRQENDSCGVCPSCQKYAKLAHPDLHLYFPNALTKEVKKDPDSQQFLKDFIAFVQGKNYHVQLEDWLSHLEAENKQATINIRDCANIIEENSTRSYEGGYKVFILWMVERLFHSAAPKLLKTLEEPEENTLFILLSEEPDKILSTIRSRAQWIKLPKPTDEMIANRLASEYSLSHETAQDLAMLSDGNFPLALSLIPEQNDLNRMREQCSILFNSLRALVENGEKAAIDFIGITALFQEIISEGRENQKRFLSYLLALFRKMLLKNSRQDTLVKESGKERDLLDRYSHLVTLRNISALCKECDEAIHHIERNGNSTIIFTDLYFRLAQKMRGR